MNSTRSGRSSPPENNVPPVQSASHPWGRAPQSPLPRSYLAVPPQFPVATNSSPGRMPPDIKLARPAARRRAARRTIGSSPAPAQSYACPMSTESPSSAPAGTGSQPPPLPPDETAPSAAPAPPAPTVTGAPPGPPIPPPPPPPRVRRRPLNRLSRFGRAGSAVVVVTVVIMLVLVGGTAWGAVRARSIQTHRTPPTVQAALDLSNLGDAPTPVPIGPESPEGSQNSRDPQGSQGSEETVVLVSGQTRVLRVAQDGREALVGIDLASASGYPAWQAPVPDELVGQALNCHLAQETLDCGDLLSIDLTTGANRASEPSALSASAPGPASSGDSQTTQTTAPDASPDPSADGSRSPAAGSTCPDCLGTLGTLSATERLRRRLNLRPDALGREPGRCSHRRRSDGEGT